MAVTFQKFLEKFDEKDWFAAVEELLPLIHEVDRNAVQIWFRFYPLALHRYLDSAENRAEAIRKFVLQGDFELKTRIDTSHRFLYGHRFWETTKKAIEQYAEDFTDKNKNAGLTEVARQIAQKTAQEAGTDESLTLSIVLAGLMTLAQVGFEDFKKAPGKVAKVSHKLPEAIVKERATDDSQGIFGFLKTVDKQFSVIFDEAEGAKFKAYLNEEITSAAARCNVQTDERCIEGPIPVECKSASCGTCWVGILGGQEKLSEVQRLERKQMKVFGYRQPEDEKPFLRLACQAKVLGNVTLVIPPWNGVFGKKVYGDVEEEVLHPATTSARKNREIVRDVVKNRLM